jgi:hypothetical protein
MRKLWMGDSILGATGYVACWVTSGAWRPLRVAAVFPEVCLGRLWQIIAAIAHGMEGPACLIQGDMNACVIFCCAMQGIGAYVIAAGLQACAAVQRFRQQVTPACCIAVIWVLGYWIVCCQAPAFLLGAV